MPVKNYITDQKFFKPDYYKALQYIIPKYLLNDDQETFGTEVDLKDQIINSHISFSDNVSSILNISSIPGSLYSNLNTFSGIAKYFIKQNELTRITPEDFELSILDRVNTAYKQFKSEEDFKEYLSGTLLPSITLNKPSSYFTQGDSPSSIHDYLIENLSWLYFLNTSGSSYSPSTFVCNLIAEKSYRGETINLNDCLKGLSEYLFKNGFNAYIPEVFLSAAGRFTSGTQQLDKLNTWIDIIYSPLYSDKSDLTVYDRFDMAVQNGIIEDNKIINGPFSKLLRMLSLAAYDISDDSERLRSLYSIQQCPDNLLPFLADLIGWKLYGSNPDRWRLQLRNAIQVYKKAGTKDSLQFALGTLFPKNIFDISSKIDELWESYVPYLIFYSLLTESEYFKSNATWTLDLAQRMFVDGYYQFDIRENAKLATDRIIFEIFLTHRNKFNIPNINNEFFYRGRTYAIPPFEEYPYYANVELDEEMIFTIIDRLVCFGVRREFADQVGEYIRANTLDADQIPRSGSWLFFTSGYNQPPNIASIISEADPNKLEFVSLWSGKSSHFTLLLDASSFDFNKKETTADSGDAVVLTSKIVYDFAPAHSIPIIGLQLNASDTTSNQEVQLPLIGLDKIEPLEQSTISNYGVSALYVSAYKRNTGSGNVIFPGPIISLEDPLLKNATVISNVPRSTVRRRNYEKLMPMNGYYDRTGFNMPVSFDPSASLSGIYLGYIPSSHSFQTISDYKNIPEIYSICLNTSSVFYGYAVSSTVKCRGHVPLTLKDYYTDRGQLNDIYYVMHSLNEDKKYLKASSILTALEYTDDEYWRENIRSYVNSATELSGWSPVDVRDYYNFKFGRNFHSLYQTYTKEFNRHNISLEILTRDGPNILSHTYGPILYNHDFDSIGNKQFIASSLSSVFQIKSSNILSIPGTTIASNPSSLYYSPSTPDIINSSIVSGIDLINVSGASPRNSFTIVRVPMSEKPRQASDYMFDRTFIKVNSVTNYPRVRIDLSRTIQDPNYQISKNFLLPNHEFKFSLNGLVCSNDGLKLGGRTLGVWIHTKQEQGKIWSYVPNDLNLRNCKAKMYGSWEQHSPSLGIQDVLNRYVQTYTFPEEDRVKDPTRRLRCIEIVTRSGNSISPLLTLEESDFSNFEFSFDTYNNVTYVDANYGNSYGQLHRKNQEYVIDIFFMPDNINGLNNFFLLDKVSITDMTLNDMSKIPLMDETNCYEPKVPTNKEQLRTIFKFFNDISGKNTQIGLASRDAAETSGVLYAQGGSRLDYRLNSDWCVKSYQSGSKILTEVEVPV